VVEMKIERADVFGVAVLLIAAYHFRPSEVAS
jgi:hypothetical protein